MMTKPLPPGVMQLTTYEVLFDFNPHATQPVGMPASAVVSWKESGLNDYDGNPVSIVEVGAFGPVTAIWVCETLDEIAAEWARASGTLP